MNNMFIHFVIMHVTNYLEKSIEYCIDNGLKELTSQSFMESGKACPFVCVDYHYGGKGYLISGIDKFADAMLEANPANINWSKTAWYKIAGAIVDGFDQMKIADESRDFYKLGAQLREKYCDRDLQEIIE